MTFKSHHQKIPLCTHSQLKGRVTNVRTCSRARVRVQSTWWKGGLIFEANIPVQELEGQRGEGAYFREDMVIVFVIGVYIIHCLIILGGSVQTSLLIAALVLALPWIASALIFLFVMTKCKYTRQ